MTIAADRGTGRLQPTEDRRSAAAEGPRRSWASTEPFVPRATPQNEADSVSRSRAWRVVSGHYLRMSVVADGFAAAVATGVTLMAWTREVHLSMIGWPLAISVLFVLTVYGMRGYEAHTLGDGPNEYQALLRAGGMVSISLMALGYVTEWEIPRSVVLAGVPMAVLASAILRHAHRKSLHRERADGLAMMRTVVVGDIESVSSVVKHLATATYHGYQVVGVCVASNGAGDPDPKAPILGAVAEVPQVVADYGVDTVVVAGSYLTGDALRRLSWALGRTGAELVVSPGLVEVSGPRLTVQPTAGLSLLRLEIEASRPRMVMKTVLDRVLGTALLLAAAPLIACSAIAVRLTSPGKAFYPQTRVGIDGRTFTMWKIRSMYVDAAERREALLARNDGSGLLFKIKDDPRVTRVGRVLRRYSLDELPQLINVVKGDMSLVGPRPPLTSEVEAYEDEVFRRLRVRPGLTGLWQVSGRSDLSWEEAVRLDLRYVDNWSVSMDLMILWKTFHAVVSSSGAY
jgi:exopolysaccharide biosynthesis polyprenyl glycosylphosphotransferase